MTGKRKNQLRGLLGAQGQSWRRARATSSRIYAKMDGNSDGQLSFDEFNACVVGVSNASSQNSTVAAKAPGEETRRDRMLRADMPRVINLDESSNNGAAEPKAEKPVSYATPAYVEELAALNKQYYGVVPRVKLQELQQKHACGRV